MSINESGTNLRHNDNPLGHELRMALHALTVTLHTTQIEADRVGQLLRTVIDLGNRTVRQGQSLPPRPFDYTGRRPAIGVGALLAAYSDPAGGAFEELLAELDAGLLAELDVLITRSEQLPAVTTSAERWATDADEVPLLLEPIDDWCAIARATVHFHAGSAATSEGTDRPVRVAWTALPPIAVSEVENGLDAARKLVADAGRPQPPSISALIDIRSVSSPSVVAPRSCAAAIALTYLAHESGLRTPGQLGVLPLAGCTKDGSWSRYIIGSEISPDTAEGGLHCLWHDDEVWKLRTGSETRSDPDSTLAGAARLLWGEDWQETRSKWAQETLDAYQWGILHYTEAAGDDDIGDWLHDDDTLLVELDQASFLAELFLQRPTSRVIQSGIRNSGKTVCARQLVQQLEASGWQTLVLSPAHRHLPTDGSLLSVVRAALVTMQADAGRRTLVVLEDLHALQDGNIGEALESLGELNVGVLALTRYFDGAAYNWDNHGVTAYPSPLSPDEMPDLARRLIERYPDACGAVDGDADIELVVDACQGDLSVLVDLLRVGVAAGSAGETGGRDALRLLRQQVENACACLDEPARAATCQLAAVSTLDESVPASLVEYLTDETLTALGVVVDGGLAQIPSEVRANVVLDCANRQGGRDNLLTWLEQYLVAMLADREHDRVRALLTNCAVYAPGALAELLERETVRQAFSPWSADAHPPMALRVLQLCARQSEPFWIAAALPAIVTRIPSLPHLVVPELTTVLKVLWDYQDQLTGTEVTDLLTWLGTAHEGLDAVLARRATVAQRRHLAHALLRLASETTIPLATVCQWLEERAAALVRGADARNHDDLINVRRLDDLIHRWSQEARGSDSPENTRHDRLRPLEKPAQALLEQLPNSRTTLASMLAWMSLRLHFNGLSDWDDLVKRYEKQIMAALAHADAIQISSAFADLARNDRGRTNQLLNHLLNSMRLGPALAAILRRSTPAEAAILLSTVRNIHGGTIKKVLYQETAQGSQVADVKLARDLAESIDNFKDARGAGMLLSSVSRADDLYCDTKDRFGYRLACELGPKFAKTLMTKRKERRPAVMYHFLRGLWEAGADYRTDLEEEALQLVVSSIQAQRGTARPWGPQLATLLIDDDYFGQNFLLQLAERLDTRILLGRMGNPALDSQSMMHTHQLSMAVAPQISEEFAKRLKIQHVVRSPMATNAGEIAQKLNVLTRTLRGAAMPDATALVLRHFKAENPQWDWAHSLRALSGIGAFTTALNQLHKFDPREAADAINILSHPEGGQRISHLEGLLIRSVVHPPLMADLLAAAERCQPGLGRAELEWLRDSRKDRWRTFTDSFRFEQDPVTQGIVGRTLANLGVVPAQESQNWMGTVVNRVWSSTMHLFASPRVIAELLTLAYIWEPQWGEQLGEKVNANKLLKRLSLRMRPDMRGLPNLVTALRLTGRNDLVEDIVRDLTTVHPALLVEAIGLEQAGRMLKSLCRANSSVEFLAPAVGQQLDRTLKRPKVADIEQHWTTIGWTAQALTECSQESELPLSTPAMEPNIVAYPASAAWAAVWLPRTEWSITVAQKALDVFDRIGVAHWYPQETCMALVASARLGRLQPAESLSSGWTAATDAGYELLTLLCREAAHTPAIADHLATPEASRRMRERVAVPGVAALPIYRELRSAVDRLCPPPATMASMPANELDL
ncbi:hypothetical protein IU479_13870 [Nocardia abscessus]|uniref:hypothetical protein n=1 Tax=Nocardia abscessus TaxID=120957 RepID=UPI0018936503|nr:hypothetical protein [Nocardia abscessus]MBF6219197.1 hypothetical protein [Nocardia abscessus]